MIVIVIGLLSTNLSSLYRHWRGLGFTWSRLQGRKHNIRIAKLAFHAKESPIRTRAEVLSLVSSRFNSLYDVYSPAIRIPPNPGLPQGSLPLASDGAGALPGAVTSPRSSPTPLSSSPTSPSPPPFYIQRSTLPQPDVPST